MPVHASLGSLAHECALRGAGPCSSCIMFRVCLVSKQGNQPPKAIISGQLLWRVPLPWLPPLISAQVLWAVLGELRPSWCWPCPPTPRARAACEATAAAQTVGEGMFQRGREVGGSWWLHPSSMWPVPGELGDCPCWLVPLPCPVPSVHSSFWDWLLSAPHCCPFQRNANWDIDSHECPGGRDSLGCLGTQGTLEFSEGPRGPRFRSRWDAFQYWEILPGRGRALSSGVWPQGSVHAAAPEEGAPGHPLPCCSSLSQNTHGFYRFLERGPWKGSLRWENPRGAGPTPVTLVSRASPQPSPGNVCRRTAQRMPPLGFPVLPARTWRRNTRLFLEFKLNNKVQRQLLWSHICNTSDCALIISTSLPARVRSRATWHGDSCGF